MKSASIISLLTIAIVFGCQTIRPSESTTPDNPASYQFVTQELSPACGTIQKPAAWKYSERHQGTNCLIWTISKENNKDGSYETGMSIQLMFGVEEGTGQTPEQFCKEFLADKAKTLKVITSYPETQIGRVQRQGIEVEEYLSHKGKKNKYHLIYSVFWDKHIVIVTTSGTPADLWDQYSHTFITMGKFTLFDLEKMSKQVEQGR